MRRHPRARHLLLARMLRSFLRGCSGFHAGEGPRPRAAAVDGFRPRFPAESTMARKATDAVIGAPKRALTDMAG